MLGWTLSAGWWIAVGIVLKILVPMPFLDDPVRSAWRWAKNKVKGFGK
jgi:hypothetical protein